MFIPACTIVFLFVWLIMNAMMDNKTTRSKPYQGDYTAEEYACYKDPNYWTNIEARIAMRKAGL